MKLRFYKGLIFAAILLFALIIYHSLESINVNEAINEERQKVGKLTLLAKGFEIEITKTKTQLWGQANEEYYEGSVTKNGINYGSLTVNQFLLANGDYYYFLRYIPRVNYYKNLVLLLPNTLNNFKYRYVTYPNGLDFQKSEWSLPITGKQNLYFPKQSVYIDDLTGSAFLSYVNVFKPEENNVRQELYDFSLPLQIQNGSVVIQLPNRKNLINEQWGVISKSNLVDWQHPANQIDLRVADLNRVRKWCLDGYYEITPSSYFPSSSTSFWRVPAHPIGEKFLRTEGSRFFEDFAIISLYTAVKTQDAKGYWTSSPRSNWLFNDYSIDASFFDTRFNTDTGMFLLKGFSKKGDSSLLDSAKRYGDYLIDFAESHHFKTKNGGYLIWDYGHESLPNIPTHVSLNHLLSEMNFLYELYKSTKIEKYLEVARKIRIAVNDTAPYWKKTENGDLWYAYMTDGTYGLQDYPQLTLRDLRYSLELIKEIEGESDTRIKYLINVKTDYLRKNNLSIY